MINSMYAEIAEASKNPQQLLLMCVIHMKNVVLQVTQYKLKVTVCQC